MLKLYNTESSQKEIFVPHKSGEVKLYVCGVTVYDHCHLGHARASLTFDVLYRYLVQKGYHTTYVRNFTDVDDKIINRANERGVAWDALAQDYIDSFHEDMAVLKVHSPTFEPKATRYIDRMISLITRLIEKGIAYESGGDVFFEVRKFPGYGKLAKKPLDELASGIRVEVNEAKRDPIDFALWKKVKPGEPSWPSPWGNGRPGWHIECSAMSLDLLGERIDIHGGGRDLIFPHHENEIAQSEAATGEPFVKYWMHNGIVNLGKSKMSKSTGNVMNLKSLLKAVDYEVIRLFVLSAHYRSPLEYSEQNVDNARISLERFYETLNRLRNSGITVRSEASLVKKISELAERYTTAMDDDLNTAQVVGAVFEFVSAANKAMDIKGDAVLSRADFAILEKTLRSIADTLGVFDVDGDFFERERARHLNSLEMTAKEVEALLNERREARKSKNFARADEIRDHLASLGIRIKDRPDGGVDWGKE